eukprot:12841906-Alexandrium_andersonii.AAC.1
MEPPAPAGAGDASCGGSAGAGGLAMWAGDAAAGGPAWAMESRPEPWQPAAGNLPAGRSASL